MTTGTGTPWDSPPTAETVFAGPGETRALLRTTNWPATPLGPVENWPEELLAAIRTVLDSELPVLLFWGPNLIQIYNDACLPNLSDRHPRAIGQPASECWREVWETLAPAVDEIMLGRERGKRFDQQLLFLQRNGHLEETFWTFSYSGIADRTGTVRGIFVQTNDAVTAQVVAARRLRALRNLGSVPISSAGSAVEACRMTLDVLAGNRADAPFGTIYLIDQTAQPRLVAGFGYRTGSPLPPGPGTDPAAMQRVQAVAASGESILVTGVDRQFPGFFDHTGALGTAQPDSALVLPLIEHGKSRCLGVLVLGISPYREFDADYQAFFHLLADQISISLTDAVAYEAQRRRAAELADLDAAKTRFFQNISHELRTPLTLLLGPLQQLLENNELILPDHHVQDLLAARRAALRLQRLVDGLLEVARGEADRSAPMSEPTDLAALTADCASMFRSVIEAAGLELVIDTPPPGERQAPLVRVDRQMWAHIVLNLLSNAVKFTPTGRILVRLQITDRVATLQVSDTGIGIPADQLPLIFDRFHQVSGQPGRTREGAGIGLSLVADLVRAHRGDIRVNSTTGEGSTFTLTIPNIADRDPGAENNGAEKRGDAAHRVSVQIPAQSTGTRPSPMARPMDAPTEVAAMFLAEAAQWRPVMSTLLTAEPGPNTVQYPSHPFTASSAERRQPLTTQQLAARQAPPHGSVLIVEDSADLRDYLTRLLGGDGWAVTPVADAETALRHQHIPDLVLVDVMLPGRDGLDLLRALRASTSVGGVPVILLTARAGPESVAEGLANGANDYLVKPFEPVELLARVRATVELNRRREIPLKRALDRAENLQLAVSTNRQIGTAVGILMAKRKLRSEQAFELLSATSQAMHRKLSELAEEIVVAGTPAALDG